MTKYDIFYCCDRVVKGDDNGLFKTSALQMEINSPKGFQDWHENRPSCSQVSSYNPSVH